MRVIRLASLSFSTWLPFPRWTMLPAFPVAWLLVAYSILFASVQACPADVASLPAQGTRIVILKQQQVLELYAKGSKVRSYRICLGVNPVGPKEVTGDQKTPEGDYFICYKSANSRFHRFLGISYPSVADAYRSFEKGVISLDQLHSIVNTIQSNGTPPWETKLGGWVGIHGYPTNEHHQRWVSLLFPKPDNWTDGCIAMWNFEIEDLFSLVTIGTPVSIVP
jgi:murein L,D-transpeptidase YafK